MSMERLLEEALRNFFRSRRGDQAAMSGVFSVD